MREIHKVQSVTPTELVNTRRTLILVILENEGTIIAVVGREPWKSSRYIARKSELPKPTVLDVTCDDLLDDAYLYWQSAHLFLDCHLLRALRLQQATDELSVLHVILRADEA